MSATVATVALDSFYTLSSTNFGADAAGTRVVTHSLSLVGDSGSGIDSGLATSNGTDIVLTISDNTITGKADGQVVFTLELNDLNNTLTLTQLQAIENPTPDTYSGEFIPDLA